LEYHVSDEQHPLSRWSQRKLAARDGGPVDEAVDERKPPDAPAPSPEAEAPVLPSIESLDAQSDYTAFLAKEVPEALTREALRKLWTSDPVFANLDGLNHYDDDYNVIDKAISVAQTSYHPEWGYLSEEEEAPAHVPKGPTQSEHQTKVEDDSELRRDVAGAERDRAVPTESPSPATETPEDSTK
jgi:hypothetical protein